MEKLISLYGQHDLVQELKGDYSSSQIKKFKLSKTSFDSIILCHLVDKLVGRHIFFFDPSVGISMVQTQSEINHHEQISQSCWLV